MPKIRLNSFCLLPVWLVLLGIIGVSPLSVAASDPLAETQKLLDQLKLQPEPKEFARVANDVGPFIDGVRQADPGVGKLKKLRGLLGEMRGQTEKRLASIENESQNSEAALERLYRSQDWDDLSFALAAFPYWRAWMDLEIAKTIEDEGLKTQALLPARKGFRAASMQLFRPGLVYGGWLGLGYVEMEEGHHARAKQIFESLENALATEEDSPIRQAVSLELRLLEARTGEVRPTKIGRKIDANEAKILRIEAFALLQESRKTGGRPTTAAERLRALIEAGYLDQSLLSDMMVYAQEIAGVNVGPWTDLAGGEFALQYDHFYNAMQKYEAFFRAVNPPPGLDLDHYRYRWALAAYKAEIYQPAVDILEKLQRKKDLSDELDKATAKLLYAVYAAREASGGSIANRKSLRVAAQRYVSKSPDDKDADAARLMIAQTSSNASTALQSLNAIKSSSKLSGDVERTAYQIIARDFSAKIARNQTKLAVGLAKKGIAAFQKLPKADKADTFNFAIVLQMRALADPNPEDVLKALDFIEKKDHSNLDIRKALIWSRLQLYNRLGDRTKVTDYVRSLAADGVPSWQMEFLYPWVADLEDIPWQLELARFLHPAVKNQPDMDRRLWVLIIKDLMETGENAAGYDEARAFSKAHPASGDAWQLLGQTAELTERPFEADRAWQVITDKAVPTMAIWWDGMLSRVRIRTQSTRPEEACPLIAEMTKSAEFVPGNLKPELERARAESRCVLETASAEP
jgi:hypothetical protein